MITMNILAKINMRPKNLVFFAIGSSLLLLFLISLFLQTKYSFSTFDPTITNYFQSLIPHSLDTSLSIFSILGTFEVTSLILICLAAVFYRKLKVIPYSLVMFFGIVLFEFIGKLAVLHPGPPHNLLRYDLPFNFPSSQVQTSFSFPSGHVSRTVFLLVVVLFLCLRLIKNKNWRALAIVSSLVFTLVMLISRIYLGEHWASDVIGGIFLGGAMGFLSLLYY